MMEVTWYVSVGQIYPDLLVFNKEPLAFDRLLFNVRREAAKARERVAVLNEKTVENLYWAVYEYKDQEKPVYWSTNYPSKSSMTIPGIQCSVTDMNKNHCPNPVIEILVVGEELIYLCDGCYVNFMNGAYGEPPRSIYKPYNEE